MMRLRRLNTEFSFGAKLKMTLMRVMSRREPPDVVKLHFYRYDLLGKPMGGMFQEAMRGPSEWSIFEREIIAAYVSQLGQCVF